MWLTENGNARSEQVLMMPTEEAIQLRMAARSAEWIGIFQKA